MLTAAKLVAALCLACLAWLVSDLVKPLYEGGKELDYFNLINLGIGLAIGWQVIGSRAGMGMKIGLANGFTGGVLLVLTALFSHAAARMFELSMRSQYGGISDALTAVLQLMADYAVLIATPAVIGTLVIGSLLVGVIAEVTTKHAS